MAKTSLRNFVEKVEDKEGIKVRAWADPETQVEEYAYDRCAAEQGHRGPQYDARRFLRPNRIG